MVDEKEREFSGRERRKYPRLRAAVVEYSFVDNEALEETSFTRDVGAGGICILVSESIEKGSVLSLKIYLPCSNDPIKAKGKVVWIAESAFLSGERKKHFDVGIEFVGIEDNDRQKIHEYVLNPLDHS